MTRNIIIFVMSPFGHKPVEHEFSDVQGSYHVTTVHTNETAIRYLSRELQEEGEKLDAAYAFVSDEVQKEHLDKFRQLFKLLPIQDVRLDSSRLDAAFRSVSVMFEAIQDFLVQYPEDTVRVHVDMTGGPRHASMLMLPLVQMLRYRGIEVGRVLYSNMAAQPPTIEDAGVMLDVLSVVGGVTEFTAFGNVSQIRYYFQQHRHHSERLDWLIQKMENLAETIKICGSYESLQKSLGQLQATIRIYEDANLREAGEEERFLSQFLPRIKEEYAPIMPREGKPSRRSDIIRWCVNKAFLQQALTYFTEWMPQVLIEQGYLTLIDPQIRPDCENKGKDWSYWGVYLLRSYEPGGEAVRTLEMDENKFGYAGMRERLNLFLDGPMNLRDLQESARRLCPKLAAYIAEAVRLMEQNKKFEGFLKAVLALPQDNPVRCILDKARGIAPLDRYMRTRYGKEKDLVRLLLSAIRQVRKDFVENLFELYVPPQEAVRADKADKVVQRREVFRQLLADGLIGTSLPEDALLDFVERYNQYVASWRNILSHAASEPATAENNREMGQSLLAALDVLERAETAGA